MLHDERAGVSQPFKRHAPGRSRRSARAELHPSFDEAVGENYVETFHARVVFEHVAPYERAAHVRRPALVERAEVAYARLPAQRVVDYVVEARDDFVNRVREHASLLSALTRPRRPRSRPRAVGRRA